MVTTVHSPHTASFRSVISQNNTAWRQLRIRWAVSSSQHSRRMSTVAVSLQ